MSDEIGAAEQGLVNARVNARMNGVDVGCGHRKHPGTAIGVDLARGVTDTSAPGECGCEWLGDGQSLPFRDAVLDYVCSRHSLEHMPDWPEALREWVRCLKPGGILCVVVPDPASPNHPGHGIPIIEAQEVLEEWHGMFLEWQPRLATQQGLPYSWGIVWQKN